MRLFIADAFTAEAFGGNPAGVAVLDSEHTFPDDSFMKKLAAELKHSETAFVLPLGGCRFRLRYFTPASEVDLCGHATIAAFTVLKDIGLVCGGTSIAETKAGTIDVSFDGDTVLMSMAEPKIIRDFSSDEAASFYEAFGLSLDDCPAPLYPEAVSTGLPDIMLPVADRQCLASLKPDFPKISELSKRHNVVGFHVFSLGTDNGITADCRNFAPLYGIDEEAATGTSNGALTYYLFKRGLIRENTLNTFLQGEAFGRPSVINSRLTGSKIYIGGRAVILFGGKFRF